MPRYYAHKPQWKQRGSSGGNRSAAPPVLETTRSPSGEFSFSGETYTPPVNRGGRSSVPSVPRSRGGTRYPSEARILNSWRHAQLAKTLLAGGLSGAVQAGLEMVSDPEMAKAIESYGWDNFMQGDLPPPFDFLNPPANWQERLQPLTRQGKGLNGSGAVAQVASDGKWYAVTRPPTDTTGWEAQVGDSLLKSMYDAGRSGFWDPFMYTTPGGGRPTNGDRPGSGDPPSAWGVVGLPPNDVGWNFYDSLPLFTNNTVVISYRKLPVPQSPLGQRFNWSSAVYRGATSAEALALAGAQFARTVPMVNGVLQPRPVAVAPHYFPLWYSQAQIPYANFLKQLAGLQVRDLPATDGWLGAEPGGKTIIPPRGPILTLPGEPVPHPPGPETKEKKARVGSGLFQIAQGLFHQITEYGDAVDALFDAIPKEKRCKTKSLVGKSWCVFVHLDDVDVGDAIVNLAWNQFEDYVIGKGLFAVNQKAAQARGDKYGFRTLNSMNGVGGLESLGELYGDFSQKYVNPRKEDLKAYLTERFGI